MAKILVVDDDLVLGEMLTDQLQRIGHEAISSSRLDEARKLAYTGDFAVIFLDVQMPDGNGLAALPEFKKMPSAPEVIIMTGRGDPDGAELAVKSGAWDYLEKPTVVKEMLLPLTRAVQYRTEKRKVSYQAISLKRPGLVGSSPQMAKCLDQVAQIALSDANVLLTGETGTGKELFAKAVHLNSRRAANNFIVVDCASLPENLVESILLGHEKGAFTGADKADIGLIKQADEGTLFLDEIGELNLPSQKKFLRVLQEQRFRPVGSNKEVTSNFRLVAATNRNLAEMVRNGQFREDLYFRLQTMTIQLPPLRKRTGDIEELAIHLINNLCQRYQVAPKGFSPDFFATLNSYLWPGNVRELINTIEVTLNNALQEPILYARHLPDNIRIYAARSSINEESIPFRVQNSTIGSTVPHPQKSPQFKEFRNSELNRIEKEYLQSLMRQCRGSIKEACTVSGLGRTRLYVLMKKHEISRLGWSV